MNSRQREARRVHPVRYGHLTNEAIGYMRIVDNEYHLFMSEGSKIRASDIDHATYEVVREDADGFLEEVRVLMDIPTEKVEPSMFTIEETK